MFEHEDSSNDSAPSNPRAGDTPGFGTGGGGSVGGGGGYGRDSGGGIAGPGPSGWESQGRGSNVTDNRPQSPVERAAGVGPGGAVNAAGPSPAIPVGPGQFPMGGGGLSLFSTPAPVMPNTVGVPTINLNMGRNPYAVEAFNQIVPVTPINTTTIAPGTQSIPGYQKPTTYSGPHGQTMSEQERWSGGGVFSNLESLYNLPEGTLGRIMKTESGYGNNPDAYKLTAGPSGPFQILESTGRKLGVVGPGYDYRLDPVESAAAAAKYSEELSTGLRSVLGRTPTTGEIGLGYQQGLGGAKALLGNPNLSAKEALAKALANDPRISDPIAEAAKRISANGGNPDAPASQFTSQKISQYGGGPANPPALMAGLDKLMSTVTGTTSDVVKAAMSAPANFADTLQSMFVTPANAGNVPVPSPVSRSYQEAGSSPDVFQGSQASSPSGETGFAVPGGQQPAAQAASSSPQNFGDWLGNLFNTSGRVAELEAQGRTALFPDAYSKEYLTDEEGNQITAKEWYRQDMERQLGRTVAPEEVKSRIVDFGQGPVVDYYTKGLDQALGEMVTGPFNAISSAFGGRGIESLPQGSSVRDKRFMDLFSPTEPVRRYGPNGDMTLEEYRQIYGR